MRVPYANPETFTSDSDRAIAQRIRERRPKEGGLLDLDRALLLSPPIADGWNTFFGAIRTGTTISASTREMIMCRVAVLNRAWYEWEQHAPLLSASYPTKERATKVLQYIFTAPVMDHSQSTSTYSFPKPEEIEEKNLAVLTFVDRSTLDIVVPSETISTLSKFFSDREIVEITATTAGYNCVSRFLVGLDVGERAGGKGLEAALGAMGAGGDALHVLEPVDLSRWGR